MQAQHQPQDQRQQQQRQPPSLWRLPLLVGVFFGLGYGITQRTLDLQLPNLVRWGQPFDVRDLPGTSLDSLRLRFGTDTQPLRSEPDLQEPQDQPGVPTGSLVGPDSAPEPLEPAEPAVPATVSLPPAAPALPPALESPTPSP